MKEFKYKVTDKFNNKFNGTIHAISKQEANSILQKKGFKVISLNEFKLNFIQSFLLKYHTKKMSIKDKNDFFKQLHSYLKLGFNIRASLDHISKNKIIKPIIRNLTHQLLQEIDKGNNFGSILNKYGFTKDVGEIIKSGEEIGNLKETIGLIVNRNELEQKVSKGFKSILIMPIILVPILLITNVLVLTKLIPKFKPGMLSMAGSESKIPPSSQFIFYLSDHIVFFSMLFLGISLGLIALFYFSFKFNKTFQMFVSKKILNTPIVGNFIYYKEMAQITSIMSLAYGAGYSNENIVDVSRKQIKNYYIKSQFNTIYKLVNNNGYTISEAMSLVSFDSSIYSLLQMGELNGKSNIIENLNHLTNEFSSLTIENLKTMESFKSTFNTLVLTIFSLPIVYFIMTTQIDQMKIAMHRMK